MHTSSDQLRSFVADVLAREQVHPEQARIVAEVLVWCERIGRDTQGVWRLPILVERFRKGGINPVAQPAFERRTGIVELLHGDHGSGHYVGHLAMTRAIELAEAGGVGIVGVHHSNYFGAASWFAHLAATRGMISLALSNSFPKVAAHGGLSAVLGTNPFGFGAPRRNGRSFLLDMSTAASAGSTLRRGAESRRALANDVAIDAAGKPVRDPRLAADATLLPFGGAKGYGLALLVDLLSGVLTGAGYGGQVKSMYKELAAPGENGHFFLAMNVASFMPLQDYYDRIDDWIATIKGSQTERADVQILIPGENRWLAWDRSDERGIELDERTVAVLAELGFDEGVVN